MKVWISKYALTKGIYEVEVITTEFETMVVDKSNPTFMFYHKGEWHKTKEDAIKRAEEMRNKKIKSLEKQINKLKNMRF